MKTHIFILLLLLGISHQVYPQNACSYMWEKFVKQNDLATVQEFSMDFFECAELPKGIGQMTNLRSFKSICTEITAFPKELLNCTQLEKLILSKTKIKEFPVEIAQLSKLKYLAILGHFESIPPEIGKLKNLEVLFLSLNYKLSNIPPEIQQLQKLRELHLLSTRLSKAELEKLEKALPNCKIIY